MKTSILFLFLLFILPSQAQHFPTIFEQSGGRKTPTYQEIVAFYKRLDQASSRLLMKTMGPTDAGYPLHLILYAADGKFDPATWHRQQKVVIMINNGIHPGEPDGIDASMLLLRDLVIGKKKIPANVVLAVIPVYNIGGCLNRSENYRVDQNGPEAFGSRGNSQNLDLNRDFIKCDSREAKSFAEIFHFLDPDIFIDNHVSNGADYQHIMTLISSQHDKLGGSMGEYMNRTLEPGLYTLMKDRGYDLAPYVNFFGDTPDKGWPEFFDSPRYSSGFATLWHSFGFTTETHMLKPFADRVQATYALMECFIEFASHHSNEIINTRRTAQREVIQTASFPVEWKNDSLQFTPITFKGYEATRKPSMISGFPRLYYDRSKPYVKTVSFFNKYYPTRIVDKPKAYIIPQGWWKVLALLKVNGVEMKPLERDTSIEVEVYRITDYKTSPNVYEGHYIHSNIQVTPFTQRVSFRKGDIVIPMNQVANRFISEVLEPQSIDSYFAWNFFDPVLTQKEGYSDYVFEDTGAEYLRLHPDLQKQLQDRLSTDSAFAHNGHAQLDFIFKHSPYYEPDHLRYPVYRQLK